MGQEIRALGRRGFGRCAAATRKEPAGSERKEFVTDLWGSYRGTLNFSEGGRLEGFSSEKGGDGHRL